MDKFAMNLIKSVSGSSMKKKDKHSNRHQDQHQEGGGGGIYPQIPAPSGPPAHQQYGYVAGPGPSGQQGGYPPQNQGYPSQGQSQSHYPPPQQNQGGYPPQNQGGYHQAQNQGGYHQAQNQGGYPPQSQGQGQRPVQFDGRHYFRQIFDDMDTNRSGTIGPEELHEALRRGQPNAQFDPRTVGILMEKYDTNRNGQIGFDEFFGLFMGINNLYNDFLDVDADFSGTVDGRELANAMRKAGYNFSPDTSQFLTSEICRRNNVSGINFDLYVRVLARMDFLRAQHQQQGQQMPLDNFIRNSFFL